MEPNLRSKLKLKAKNIDELKLDIAQSAGLSLKPVLYTVVRNHFDVKFVVTHMAELISCIHTFSYTATKSHLCARNVTIPALKLVIWRDT